MTSIFLPRVLLGAGTALVAAIAAAEETAPATPTPAPATYTLAGNVGVVSDYLFRGVSNSNRKPALQAGLEWGSYRHEGFTPVYGAPMWQRLRSTTPMAMSSMLTPAGASS